METTNVATNNATVTSKSVLEHVADRYKQPLETVIKELYGMQFPVQFIEYLGATQGTAIHIKQDRWASIAGTNSIVPAGYDAETVSFFGSVGIVSHIQDQTDWVNKDVLAEHERRYADIRLSFTLHNGMLNENELKVCREAVDWYAALTPEQKAEKKRGKHGTLVAAYPRKSFWLDICEGDSSEVWLQIMPLIQRKQQDNKLVYTLCGKQVLWQGLRLHGQGMVDNTPSEFKPSTYAPQSEAAVHMKQLIAETIRNLNQI